MTFKRYWISLLLNFVIVVAPTILMFNEESLGIAYLIIWIVISIPTVSIVAIFRKSKSDIMIIGLACGLPILLSGLLFRIMHWPGGIIQTYAGIALVILSLIMLIVSIKKSNTAGNR